MAPGHQDMAAAADPARAATTRATLMGMGAILLWATLTPLGVATGAVPPFLLTGLTFAVGGMLGLTVQKLSGRPIADCFRAPWRVWLLTVGTFFGYHAAYFIALRLMPPIEALLVINIWPLAIVLLTALLIPGNRLEKRHILGAVAGFSGSGLIVLSRDAAVSAPSSVWGYLAAASCVLIWSGYSVINRRVAGEVKNDAVTGFCLATSCLAFLVAALFEPWAMPQGGAWLAILALGIGPMGAAFFLWDIGSKRGDLRLLGVGAYAGPLLGAILLVVIGATR
jgi:drug/metabolite transporter (DMT)-like permease